MKDPINKVGIELEGRYDQIPSEAFGEWKSDSSVEFDGRSGSDDCDGRCRDDCECYNDCDCERCSICEGCNSSLEYCDCDDCLICDWCGDRLDGCDCDRRDNSCENKKCNEDHLCDDCKSSYDERVSHNCSIAENITFDCDGDCGCECSCECDCYDDHIGEFVSYPLKVDEVEKWIYDHYPTETNSTCGGHTHISLKSASDYMALMEHDFNDFFLSEMEKWGKKMKINEGSSFWRRLNGDNSMCKLNFQPEDQRNMTGHYQSERYCQLNYCYNVDNRKTLEIRLLPCFQKDYLMVSGVNKIIDIIRIYLQKRQRDIPIKMRFEI